MSDQTRKNREEWEKARLSMNPAFWTQERIDSYIRVSGIEKNLLDPGYCIIADPDIAEKLRVTVQKRFPGTILVYCDQMQYFVAPKGADSVTANLLRERSHLRKKMDQLDLAISAISDITAEEEREVA